METKYISTDNAGSLRAFNAACDEIAAGRFILADKTVRSLLHAIAASRRLLSVFAYCADGFVFEREFERAAGGGADQKRLALPGNAKDYVAFVYCILFETDNGGIALTKLLSEYYDCGGGVNESFSFFCAGVLLPFKELVNGLFSDKSIGDLEF
jgi:hypothetical protein